MKAATRGGTVEFQGKLKQIRFEKGIAAGAENAIFYYGGGMKRMGKKRYRPNIVQLADQVSGSPDLALGAPIPAEDITLLVTVRPNGNTFTCDIANLPHMVHAPMTWTWADFEAELDALKPYARQLSKPGAATPNVIQEIAARGKILFEKVFATEAARSAIRDACAGPGATEILFYTESFALCWPLLYLGTDIQKPEVD